MMRTKVSVVALLAGLISVPAFAAGVYKWVDTQGGIHYSDTAQPGWRRVDISPTVVDAGALQPSADASTSGKRAAECKQKRDALVDYKRSEEHTSELQSLMRISYAVFCLKNTKTPKA